MNGYRFRAHANFTTAKMVLWTFFAALALTACSTARHCPAQMAYGGYEYTQREAERTLETIVRAQEMYKLRHKKFASSLAVLVKSGELYDKSFSGITKDGDSVVRYNYFFTQVECKKDSFTFKAVPVNGGIALVVNHKRELEELPNQPPPDRELVKSLTERVPSKILRAIAEAQKQYREKNKKFAPALAVLVKDGLLSYKEFADIQKDGEMTQAGEYLFIQEQCSGDAYSIVAEPLGRNEYYSVDQTGKVESDLRQDQGLNAIERLQNQWRLDEFLRSIVSAEFAYREKHKKYAPCLAALDKSDLHSRDFIFGDNKQTKDFKYLSLKRNGDGMQYGEHLIVQKECSDRDFKFLAIPIGKNQAFRVDHSGKNDIIQTTSDLRFSQALYSLRKIAYAQVTYKTINDKFAPSLAALVNADLLLIPELKTVMKNGDSVQVDKCTFTQDSCSEKGFQVSLKFSADKRHIYLVDENLLIHTKPSAATSPTVKAPATKKPAPPKAKPATRKKKSPQ